MKEMVHSTGKGPGSAPEARRASSRAMDLWTEASRSLIGGHLQVILVHGQQQLRPALPPEAVERQGGDLLGPGHGAHLPGHPDRFQEERVGEVRESEVSR